MRFVYDANGNLNSYKGNAIGWYSYNLPSTISAAGQSSQFHYGPNRNRWKQVASYASGTETTIYVGGLLEKLTTPSGTAWRHTIGAGSAKVLYTRWSTGQVSTKYVTADHLGSSTVVMDSAGAALVSLSFGSYGARRDSDWTGPVAGADLTQISNATRRGYTGHEHLDNLALVHMNGRVFDPALGRFLSADPFMPGALGSQASNRYAYVGNRPQSLVDPSGYFPRGGNALKQWLDGPGQLDALELAINRGWLMWGGVRNVSDGIEGTHAGLLLHSLEMFAQGNYSPSVLSVVGGSGSAGLTAVSIAYSSGAVPLVGNQVSSAIGGPAIESTIGPDGIAIFPDFQVSASHRYTNVTVRGGAIAPQLTGGARHVEHDLLAIAQANLAGKKLGTPGGPYSTGSDRLNRFLRRGTFVLGVGASLNEFAQGEWVSGLVIGTDTIAVAVLFEFPVIGPGLAILWIELGGASNAVRAVQHLDQESQRAIGTVNNQIWDLIMQNTRFRHGGQ